MLRETGSTRVMAGVGASGSGVTGDSVLRAVLATVAGEYELLGELGRGVAGTIMYLARELDSAHLVVLRLDPAKSGDGAVLSVVRELDASVAGGSMLCPECGGTTVGWGRYCPACGADLARGEFVPADFAAGDDSPAMPPAAIDEYDILGSIPRAGGRRAGVVHFARDLATGGVVALAARVGSAGGANPAQPGYRVLQSLRPLAAPAAVGAAWHGNFYGEHELAPVQPPRAQPTPHRASPQAVLIPGDELASPDDRLPPRPVRQMPRWWIAPAGVALAAVVALAAFVKARASRPDGTDARLGSGGMGITLPAASASTVAPRSDSGFIRVAAQLPPGAAVTINGVTLSGESTALTPGEYVLAAKAPGYTSVSERLTLEPGQTLVWMPTLAATRDAEPARPGERKSAPPAKKARKDVAESTTPARAPAEAPAQAPAPTCQSAFDAKDWALAAKLCLAEARGGGVVAERNLGVMYDRGVGVPRDPATAAEWLQKAAESGSRDAAYQLGAMYETGRGVEKDDSRALTWYRKAALLGDRESQVKVGKAYEEGRGVATDMGEALTWYRKAAGQGDSWAQNYIGFLYGNGKGVRHDDAEALRWFRQAAANGNAQAEYNVGFMYANGRGVNRSEAEAVRWYRQAARHGYEEAKKELERRGIEP